MRNKSEGRNSRRNYFIDKAFQSNFIFRFSLLVAFGGALTIALLYLLAGQSTTVAIVNSRVVVNTTADFILPILVQTVAIVTILVGFSTAIVTLFISHRIAGPMFRFKKVIQRLGEGDFSSEFNIRSSDQLREIADLMNAMIRTNKLELTKIRAQAILLKSKLESISEKDVPQHLHGALYDARRLSQDLETTIHFFKI